MFKSIYDEHNREFYDDKDLLLRINEELSRVDELMRKENLAGVIQYLPRLFAWLVTFANRVDINISEALWEKYPGVCPYCLKKRNCMCITQETKYTAQRPELKKIREGRKNVPQSLTEWQQLLANIYGKVNKVQMLIQVWLHVSEEIGEICRAFRRRFDNNLREELADATAWILSTATKLGVDLQQLVLQRYPGCCDVCGKEKCQCEIL